jgi:hypothetical protein
VLVGNWFLAIIGGVGYENFKEFRHANYQFHYQNNTLNCQFTWGLVFLGNNH